MPNVRSLCFHGLQAQAGHPRTPPCAPYAGGVRTGGVLSRLGLLTAVSAVAGILMAGMLLPIVGGIGLIARAGANDFESLPSVLKEAPLPQVSRILAADGPRAASVADPRRGWVDDRDVLRRGPGGRTVVPGSGRDAEGTDRDRGRPLL